MEARETPFAIPEDRRKRLTQNEMHTFHWLLNMASTTSEMQDIMMSRIEMIPNGADRLSEILDKTTVMIADLRQTIPEKQWKHIYNTARDMEVRLVPKMTPRKVSVVLTADEGKELVDAAQEKCRNCVDDNEESRKCKLRRLLEVVVPLRRYDTILCPYSREEWEE